MRRNTAKTQMYQKKVIKEKSDIFTDFIPPAISASISKNEFPSFLKLTDVIPFLKKGSKNSKHNYRPISILKNISKVYERVMFKQIRDFMEVFFSKFQCGFRKSYSTQQCFIALIEKWKSATDKGKSFGTLLTALSKSFDSLLHELLIAKSHTYGINIANYVDDNTPFVSGDKLLNALTSLENAAEKPFAWFTNNHMKANHGKCHLLMSTLTLISINIKDYIIKNSDNEKLLGVTVDTNLSFNCD